MGWLRSEASLSEWSRSSTWRVSTWPRKARLNAPRLRACSRHAGWGCNHAPLPESRRRSSISTALRPSGFPFTNRSKTAWSSRFRQPTQVRITVCRDGNDLSLFHSSAYQLAGLHLLRNLVLRPWQRQRRCRCANRSASPPAGRSGPLCRWRAKADSREQPHGPIGCPHR